MSNYIGSTPLGSRSRANLADTATGFLRPSRIGRSAGRVDFYPAAAALPRELVWFGRLDPARRFLRGRAYWKAKRFLDVAIVIAVAPLILPLMTACWLALKATAPLAPALFVQRRTGRHGRRFRMFKFRTMVPNAEDLKASVAARSKLKWPDFKVDDDPRITRLGRFLRKTSLDELPQLINVLLGDMSLVGPRPTSFGPETYQPWQRERLQVTPGLTGLWQIAGRASLEFDERVRLDLAYIERRSILVDVLIVARTVGAVVRRQGAC